MMYLKVKSKKLYMTGKGLFPTFCVFGRLKYMRTYNVYLKNLLIDFFFFLFLGVKHVFNL